MGDRSGRGLVYRKKEDKMEDCGISKEGEGEEKKDIRNREIWTKEIEWNEEEEESWKEGGRERQE